jgi:type VI secretion system secreted protein VgrG
MSRTHLALVASLGLVTLLFGASGASAQVSPGLGDAESFSILAGSEVTNTGATTISGDVGISPGIGPPPHYSGFGTVVLGGTLHDADTAAANAQADSGIAYTALDQGCTFTYAGTKELAGTTLLPGVHCADSFHLTAGTLTLSGAASDTWVFKSASDLVVTGGAAATVVSPSCNVWWRVVSTASLDAGSSLTGNVLAEWAFITLAVLLASAGILALRRRRLA